MSLVNGSVSLSSEISDASLWIIQSHGSSYRIVHVGSDNGDGLVFSVYQSTANLYLGNEYFYGIPIVRDYGDMPFDNWSLIPVSDSGIVLRNDLYGTLHNSTSATGCVGNAGVTLSDIGYSIVAFGSGSDAVDWTTGNSAVTTVMQNGAMNLLSVGSATIKAAISSSQYVTLNLSIIAADFKTYFVRNAETGLYADIQNGTMSSGNEVEQQTFDGTNTQKWRFYRVIGTAFAIRSNQNISYYLGVENDTVSEGADIVLRTGTVTGGMKWRLEADDEGYRLASCLNSHYGLSAVSRTGESGEGLMLAKYTNMPTNELRENWRINSPVSLKMIGVPDEINNGHDHSSCLHAIKNLGGWNDCILYNSSVSLSTCKNSLATADVFISRSHGQAIMYNTGGLSRTGISLKYITSLENQIWLYSYYNEAMDGTPDGALEDAEIYLAKIVAFVGCETGYVDTGALEQRNLPQRMVGLGTETAIGFKINIGCNSANIWTTTFYTSLLNGDNVLQAVIKACGRSNILLENVTICGNVYNTLK